MAIGDFTPESKTLEAAGIDYGVATLPVEQAGDPPYLRGLDRRPSPSSATATTLRRRWSSSPSLAPRASACGWKMIGDAPLSAAAAEEFGWAEQGDVEAREQFLQVIGRRSQPSSCPGFWDVVAPLADAFNLIAEGDVTAAEALDEVAPRMQDSLDQTWETWEQFGG